MEKRKKNDILERRMKKKGIKGTWKSETEKVESSKNWERM